MKLVIFGLSISSAWGDERATQWQGLRRSLGTRGHKVVSFERDPGCYAAQRHLTEMAGVETHLYRRWEDVQSEARKNLADADAAIVTSHCFDRVAASDLTLSSSARISVFYDLDLPAPLSRSRDGKPDSTINYHDLGDYDLVISYMGGRALSELKLRFGARRVAPLYASVDPRIHFPAPAVETYAAHLSYLGSYEEDRREAINTLLFDVARRAPDRRFLIGGSNYPATFGLNENIRFINHIAPAERSAFYSSSALTLNTPCGVSARVGWRQLSRLFEAAACGAPIITDWWEGLDQFLEPGEEIIIARSTDDMVAAMKTPVEELAKIALRARARAVEEHSVEHRAAELENLLESVRGGAVQQAVFMSFAH